MAEQSTGFPCYNATIGPENATIGRILIENGYRTAWIGKNHNTPDYAQSQAGPFDQWPKGMGFQHYYGFNGGDTSQWQPNLFLNTTQIYPCGGQPKWNRITAMVDDAIGWMDQLNSIDPTLPFFLYYVPGGTHAPHHPTPEWIDRIHAMQDRLWTELASHQVLPLDSSLATRLVAPRPSVTAGRTEFDYSGRRPTGIPRLAAPSLLNTSYSIKADITVPPSGAEGMINTLGGRFGGYGLYLLKGKPLFVWNLLGLKEVRWEATAVLPPGKHTLEFDFAYDGLGFVTLAFNDTSGIGHGGTGTFKVDGAFVAEQKMDQTIPLLLPLGESFDIGADTLTGVTADYPLPFDFTGTIDGLKITLDSPKITPEQTSVLKAKLDASLRDANNRRQALCRRLTRPRSAARGVSRPLLLPGPQGTQLLVMIGIERRRKKRHIRSARIESPAAAPHPSMRISLHRGIRLFSLFQNLASLAFESQQVIFLRTMKMVAGGPSAEAEARLMVAEKLAAAQDATLALMSGKAVDHVVSSYRRRVQANSSRLMKG